MTAPAAPTATPPPEFAQKRYKMILLQSEAMVTPSGLKRYQAGAVLLTDEATALRWYEHGIAEIAPPDAETIDEVERRVKREEFLRRAKPAEGVFDAAVTRGSFRDDPNQRQLMPPPMPVPNRRRSRADLAGAEVVTDPTGDED